MRDLLLTGRALAWILGVMTTCGRCKRDVDGIHLCLPNRKKRGVTSAAIAERMDEFWSERTATRLSDAMAALHGHDRGMPIYDFPCKCGRTFRGTDRDRGKRCEHTEESGIWCADNGTWSCARTDVHVRASCYDGRAQGIPTIVSDAHPSPFRPMRPTNPKPPTLREWLGPRVAELGPWAEVLREQPVPAGMIVAWHWDRSGPEWLLIASDRRDAPRCGTAVLPDLSGVFDRCDDGTDITCWMESLQMALFTRHPAVKPEPRITIGCEDQYEVMP